MPQGEYGAVSVLITIYTFLNIFTFAELPSATFRFYNEPQEEANKQLILGTSQFLFFLFAAIPAIGILIFPKPISMLLLGSEQYALAFQFMAGFLVIDTMNTFGNVILRVQIRPLMSSIHSIILIACETGMAIFFVVVSNMGVAGYWLGYLTGATIGLLVMIWLVRKAIVFRISRDIMGELLRFSIPLIPGAVSMTALRLADRYIIGAMVGLEQVAIYDVGYKVGSLIGLIIAPFRAAWHPFAFSIAKKTEAHKVYRDVLTYISAGCFFIILGVIAFRGELVNLIAPESYAEAANVVSWVAVSQVLTVTYIIFAVSPLIMKKTRQLAWASMTASGINLFLNFLLIPMIGILGAAIATFIGYLVLSIITYFLAKQSFAITVDWKRMIKLLAASGVVGLIIYFSERFIITPWMETASKISALALFPVLLLLFSFIKLSQLQTLIEIGKTRITEKFSTNHV